MKKDKGFTAKEQDKILAELQKHGFECGHYLCSRGRLDLLCTGRLSVAGEKFGWPMLPIIEIEKRIDGENVSYMLKWIPPIYQFGSEVFDNKITMQGIKPGEFEKTMDKLFGDIDLIQRRQLPLYDIKF